MISLVGMDVDGLFEYIAINLDHPFLKSYAKIRYLRPAYHIFAIFFHPGGPCHPSMVTISVQLRSDLS